jgi:transmembrane sensor
MRLSNYDKLVDQYLKGQLSGEEKKKFEAWLDMKKTRRAENFELTPEDEERVYKQIMSRVEGVKELEPLLKKTTRRPMLWAASIALLVGLSAYAIWFTIGEEPGFTSGRATMASSNEKMILNDGSIVWLRGDSKIFYSESTIQDTRFARLQGEAFFEVAKDPSRPFIIECGNSRVTVVGTAFHIKSRNDSVQVIVMSGKVHVDNGQQKFDLTEGQQISYAGAGTPETLTISDEEKVEIIKDTEYDMKFNDATLDAITKRISQKFNVNVELENEAAGRCHITGDFTDCSLDTTLAMISEVLDVNYEVNAGKVIISGMGCSSN